MDEDPELVGDERLCVNCVCAAVSEDARGTFRCWECGLQSTRFCEHCYPPPAVLPQLRRCRSCLFDLNEYSEYQQAQGNGGGGGEAGGREKNSDGSYDEGSGEEGRSSRGEGNGRGSGGSSGTRGGAGRSTGGNNRSGNGGGGAAQTEDLSAPVDDAQNPDGLSDNEQTQMDKNARPPRWQSTEAGSSCSNAHKEQQRAVLPCMADLHDSEDSGDDDPLTPPICVYPAACVLAADTPPRARANAEVRVKLFVCANNHGAKSLRIRLRWLCWLFC